MNPSATRETAYAVRLRIPVAVTAAMFIASMVMGYFAASLTGVSILQTLRESLLPVFQDFNALEFMLVVFANNSVKTFAVIILGVTLGIVPAFFVAANGFILGMVVAEVQATEGLPIVLASLLPHGVLELPAVIVGAALGMRIGLESIRKITGRGAVLREVRRSIRLFVKWLLPILLVAAAVETFITPLVVSILTSI